jgi:phenylpropionate dioxygenase-like ring-hydroxylating dioxygenase large terminal subunit
MFHGWTFATDGRLIGVTDKTQFPDLDPADTGLIPIHAETWEDYVFVNFDPQPSGSLRDWLGKLHDEYTGAFADRQRLGSYRIEVNSNWNITTNAFTEGYHSAFLHKDSVPDYQGGKGNPMRHRPYLEVTERHGRYSAKANPNHKMTPVEDLAYRFGRKMFPAFPHVSELGTQPPGINPGRNELWAFDVLELFPCTVLLMGAHWHATMWFWPIDENRTDIRIDYFGYKAKTVGDHLAHAYFRVRNREVFREDVGTMEACGQTLKAGAMQEIILSQQEMLIQNHYRVASEMVGPPGQEQGRTSQPMKFVQRSAA